MNYKFWNSQSFRPISRRFIILVCFFLATALLRCFGLEKSHTVRTRILNIPFLAEAQQQNQADVSSIDRIVNAIYAAITFQEGESPDMERFRGLFTPDASFIRITGEGVNKMTTDSFIASFRERIKTGVLKSFHESEIYRKMNTYGSMAQVFTTYRKGLNTKDPALFVRGINSLQLYYDGQRWWIASLVWEDERSDNPIPEEYLK